MECTRTCGWTRSARDDADHGGFIRVQAGVHEGACGVLHAAVVACLPMVGTGVATGGGAYRSSTAGADEGAASALRFPLVMRHPIRWG